MKIRLDRLYEGEHRLDSRLNPADLELESFQFTEPVDIVLHWDRRDPYVRLRIEIMTHRQAQCDRCLDDVRLDIATQAEILVQLRDTAIQDTGDPDFRVVTPDDVEIDFTVDIRDALLLAVPTKVLCRDDCKGLCSQCGTNLNDERCSCMSDVVHPQWEALQRLKKSI